MRPTRTLTRLAVAVALVGALGTLAACGSDDSGTPTGTPTDGTSAPSGDETDTASGGLVDICTKVTDDEVADLVGGPVTRKDVPGGGCTFDQEDPKAFSVSLSSSALDPGNGGFEGAVTGVSSQFEGDGGGALDGVGDQAYAKTGTVMGSGTLKGGGLVLVGGTLVQVTVLQGNELPAEKVQAVVVDTLNLVATKL